MESRVFLRRVKASRNGGCSVDTALGSGLRVKGLISNKYPGKSMANASARYILYIYSVFYRIYSLLSSENTANPGIHSEPFSAVFDMRLRPLLQCRPNV